MSGEACAHNLGDKLSLRCRHALCSCWWKVCEKCGRLQVNIECHDKIHVEEMNRRLEELGPKRIT